MRFARAASTAACLAAVVFAATTSLAPHGTIAQVMQPPRDQPPALRGQTPPRVGTASLKGRVLDGATGQPVSRARVRFMGGSSNRPLVITDAQGRFTFTGLPAGPVALTVEKSTYLTTVHPESARTIRGTRVALLKDGEAMDLTLRLHHGGAVTGRVVDAYGDLVENADVRAVLLARGRGGRPTTRSGAASNDIGEFRVPRLEPGHYVLMATARARNPDEAAETQPIPTYYPGVASIEDAQPIIVERGQTVSGVEVTLLEGTSSVVSGLVVDATGAPVTSPAYVNSRLVMRDATGAWFSPGGTNVKPDGTFQLKLTPGDYELEVSTAVFSAGPGLPGDQQVGLTRVAVGAGPLTDVLVRLARPGTLSGRIVFEGASPLPKEPRQVGLTLTTTENTTCRSSRTETAADWSFKMDGVFGTCTINVMSAPGDWTIKSITRGNENLLDRPVIIRPGQNLRDVMVVFTDKRTELKVKVTDEGGQVTSDYVALVFPVDKERWTLSARYVQVYTPPPAELVTFRAQQREAASATPGARQTAPVREGFPPLPPGDYYVVAVDDIEREQVRDPGVLAELAPSAVRVALDEGTSITVPLRVVKFLGK